MAGSLEQKTNQADKNIVLLSAAWCKRIAMGQRIVGGACWNIMCLVRTENIGTGTGFFFTEYFGFALSVFFRSGLCVHIYCI
jgi:hypothetical protein